MSKKAISVQDFYQRVWAETRPARWARHGNRPCPQEGALAGTGQWVCHQCSDLVSDTTIRLLRKQRFRFHPPGNSPGVASRGYNNAPGRGGDQDCAPCAYAHRARPLPTRREPRIAAIAAAGPRTCRLRPRALTHARASIGPRNRH